MAKRNYAQHMLLVAIVVFIIVGIANYGATPSGSAAEQSTRFDVTEYTCTWANGWHWIGYTSEYKWTLGHILTRAEAYCNDPAWRWVCVDDTGRSLIGTSHDCTYGDMEGAVCTCIR